MFPESYGSEDRISTRCVDLVGDWTYNWDKAIKVGCKYWTWPTIEVSSILRQRKTDWTLIEVTYIRSGVIFYQYIEDKNNAERWMPHYCNEAKLLHPSIIMLNEYGFGCLRGKNWDTLHGRIKIV